MGAIMWFWIEWRAYHDLPHMLVSSLGHLPSLAATYVSVLEFLLTCRIRLRPTLIQGFPENLLDEHH